MTGALAFQEPPQPTVFPTVSADRAPRRPWVHYRDPGYLALLLEGLRRRGRRALYAGTAERLLSIATDPRMRSLLPSQSRWELPPIAQVVAAARKGIPEVLCDASQDPAILGFMCLPPKAVEHLLNPATRGGLCLVVDGLDFNDPDEGLAVAGLEALARRTGAAILVLP